MITPFLSLHLFLMRFIKINQPSHYVRKPKIKGLAGFEPASPFTWRPTIERFCQLVYNRNSLLRLSELLPQTCLPLFPPHQRPALWRVYTPSPSTKGVVYFTILTQFLYKTKKEALADFILDFLLSLMLHSN